MIPAVTALLAASLLLPAQAQATMTIARSEARAGRVDAAVAALHAVLATDTTNAEAHELLCGLHASIDQRDEAITECEAAANLLPGSSMYALQLARAEGDKADHSGNLSGLRLVGRIRSNFERAVQLDNRNVEALSDLGEFYVQAPGIVGGGTDKARALVAKLQPLSPARAHRLAGLIAAKEKDDITAEREFQAAIAVSHTPESYYDLANFYRSRKRFEQAAEQGRLAIEHDGAHGLDSLDAATLLLDLKREIPAVQAGVRGYLTTSQDHVAYYARAHLLLGNSYRVVGDSTAAQQEYAAALALAHDYEAARKAATP